MSWTQVEYLESGESYYRAVLAAIHAARESVQIEKYIFRCDRTGKEILSALAQAQSRGVHVYIRVDGVGSREEVMALGEFSERHGLELEVFHPLPFATPGAYRPAGFARVDGFLMRWRMLNRRMHRKVIIIDETIAFTGGRNVDDVENELYVGTQAWHDLSVRLEGGPMRQLVEAFWLRPFRSQPSTDFLLNYNWRLRLQRNTWFVQHLGRTKERFWVVTPYFAPTPSMLRQLRHAARRGVDIRLVLPKKNDVELSRLAAHALYRQLLKWGVKIYEFEPSILHRKLWVIDELTVVGSGNLNHRSFIHDLEIDMIFRNPAHVRRSQELFMSDVARSREISVDDLDHLPWWKRMVYSMASWLVYWL